MDDDDDVNAVRPAIDHYHSCQRLPSLFYVSGLRCELVLRKREGYIDYKHAKLEDNALAICTWAWIRDRNIWDRSHRIQLGSTIGGCRCLLCYQFTWRLTVTHVRYYTRSIDCYLVNVIVRISSSMTARSRTVTPCLVSHLSSPIVRAPLQLIGVVFDIAFNIDFIASLRDIITMSCMLTGLEAVETTSLYFVLRFESGSRRLLIKLTSLWSGVNDGVWDCCQLGTGSVNDNWSWCFIVDMHLIEMTVKAQTMGSKRCF